MSLTQQEEEVARLRDRLEQVQRENDNLHLENTVFDGYLRRHDQHGDDVGSPDENQKVRSRRAGRGKRGRTTTPALTIDQKLEVAQAEVDQAKQDAAHVEQQSVKLIDNVRALIEQTDMRLAEIKKDVHEFNRDIVVGAEDPRTGVVQAERVLRWMQDRVKAKDALVKKLNLNNSALRSQIGKLRQQVQAKEEMGDVLHYIDFHQLQIENKQYLAKIEERNAQLYQLKMSTGRTVQRLNSLKATLGELSTECTALTTNIEARRSLLGGLQRDNDAVAVEISRGQRAGDRLQAAVAEAVDLPTVLDYAGMKARFHELQRDVSSWERKVEIAQMASKRSKATLTRARQLAQAQAAMASSSPLARAGSALLNADSFSAATGGGGGRRLGVDRPMVRTVNSRRTGARGQLMTGRLVAPGGQR